MHLLSSIAVLLLITGASYVIYLTVAGNGERMMQALLGLTPDHLPERRMKPVMRLVPKPAVQHEPIVSFLPDHLSLAA